MREALAVAPLAHDRERRAARGTLAGIFAEQRDLCRRTLCALRVVDCRADRCDQGRAPRFYAVERACADQRLDGTPVDRALVDAPAEIEQIAEGSAGVACRSNGLDGRLSRAFDATQS